MLILKIIEFFLICLCFVIVIGIFVMAIAPSNIARQYKNLQRKLKDNEELYERKLISYNVYMKNKYKYKTKIEEIEEMYRKAYEFETKKETREDLENYKEEGEKE